MNPVEEIRLHNKVAELEEKVRELSCLLEVTRVISADLEPDHVLMTVLDQAICVLDAAHGSLWTLEENNSVIRVRATIGPASPILSTIRLKPGEGIAGRVIESGRGELVADAQNDPRWSNRVDAATGLVTHSVLTAPLNGENGTIGCLQLINRKPTNDSQGEQFFEPSDLEMLTALGTQAALVIENSRLLEQTRAFANDLERAWSGTLNALGAATTLRDNDTQAHCFRTVELSILLARRLEVSEDELASLARGALLHDIGKIGIPDHILFKPGKLSDEEREVMKMHVQEGHDMLKHIDFFKSSLPVVLYHHENFDGSGYLSGIKGEEIPLIAGIFHVVDCYDALTSKRPYKDAWTHEATIAELKKQSGAHFDPRVIAALEQLTSQEVTAIRNTEGFSAEVRALLGRREL